MQSKKSSAQSKKLPIPSAKSAKSQPTASVKPMQHAAHNHLELEKEISMLRSEVVDLKKLVSDLLNVQNQSRNLEVDIAMIKNELSLLAESSTADPRYDLLIKDIKTSIQYPTLRKRIKQY